ncbi:MAG: NAD-dependent epimerase/dehydratase family protein [Pirellula sp.]|jgi:dihydroflavonol-4-reductase|nr:NAD-dependent epimerase/dehydratase family protein [Pirellula sp.]
MTQSRKKILVTGATGLLGNNIARKALELGLDLVTLSRSPKSHLSLRDVESQHIQADVTDDALEKLLQDSQIDCVIHSAAKIHIGWKQLSDSLSVNESGTRRIVEWARKRQTRVVHVSTVNCLPLPTPGNLLDESGTGGLQTPSSYVVSKQAAQRVCDEAIERGDDCFAVYPGFMLGPYDWQLSSGKMILALQKFRPWAPAGGCSVCDPRDVASAILKIAVDGAPARHYILAGENITYLELWTQIAKQLSTRPPVIAMRKPARVIGKLLADISNACRKTESEFNSAAIEMAQQFHHYDSSRAHRDLQYASRSYLESLTDAVQWLREQGKLGPQKQANKKPLPTTS